MKIIGIDGLSDQQVRDEVDDGAKFVIYQYTISVLVMTFKRSSDIHFVRPGDSTVAPRLGWSALTLLLGWWGIPWGPIYTLQTLWVNASGGRDVTAEILAHGGQTPAPIPQAPAAR